MKTLLIYISTIAGAFLMQSRQEKSASSILVQYPHTSTLVSGSGQCFLACLVLLNLFVNIFVMLGMAACSKGHEQEGQECKDICLDHRDKYLKWDKYQGGEKRYQEGKHGQQY